MRISFRQGLISYTKDGNGAPQFLLPAQAQGFVTLSVSPTPVLITFAHGAADYLETFDATVPNAWGPLISGQDNYLYWDIDLLTSQVSYGITTLEPVVSELEPEHLDDQHWFDLRVNKLKVWSNSSGKWLEKIRVFAGEAQNGNVNQLISNVTGSQVGLVQSTSAGFIMLDSQLHPIRTSTGEFLTTDTPVRIETTVGTSGVLANPPNAFIPIRAGENLPAMAVVYFSGEDTVSLASSDPALINKKTPIGIVQAALAVNELGVLTQAGEITWDQWDWSASISKPLYVNSAGSLTATRPEGLLAYRAGFVKNRNTILFNVDAETNPQIYTVTSGDLVVAGNAPVGTSSVINELGEHVVTISLPPATAQIAGYMTTAQAAAVTYSTTHFTAIDADLTSLHAGKANLVHTHALSDLEEVGLLTGAASGDVLSFSSGEWIPRTLNFDDRYSLLTHNHDGRYALAGHTHAITEVTGLQTALTGKASRTLGLLSFDRVYTTVDQSDTNDIGTGQTLTTALAGKASTSHTHPISAVVNLQAELDARAPLVHTHLIAQVTGLQAALDGKADNGSAPTSLSELDDVGIVNPLASDVLTFVGGEWINEPGLVVGDGVGEWFPRTLTFTGNVEITPSGQAIHIDIPTPALDDLSDVDAATPALNDMLAWNGTSWAAAPQAASPALADLTDVNASSPSPGDTLVWNGTAWVSSNQGTMPLKQVTVTVNRDIGSAGDYNTHFRSTASSAVVLHVKPDSFWSGTQLYWENSYTPNDPGPMPIGGTLLVGQVGTGSVTFQADPGVTINTPDSLVINKRYGKVTLIKVGSNEWDLEGNLAP